MENIWTEEDEVGNEGTAHSVLSGCVRFLSRDFAQQTQAKNLKLDKTHTQTKTRSNTKHMNRT